MTITVLVIILIFIYFATVVVLRHKPRKHMVASVVSLLFAATAIGKEYYGTPYPGTWLERGEYISYAMVRMKSVSKPFEDKIGVATIHTKHSAGADILGPVIRRYWMVELNNVKMKKFVLVNLGRQTRAADNDGSFWDFELLPGDPLATLPSE